MNTSVVRPLSLSQQGPLLTTVNNRKLQRNCTDITCLTFYLIFIVLCIPICVGITAKIPYHNRPLDIDHQPCIQPYSYLYIPSFGEKSVCVQFCPGNAGILLPCQPNSAFPLCPLSVSGLIRNQVYKICHVIGVRAPKQNPIKTFWNLSLKYKDVIIQGALYSLAISVIVVMLTIIGPQVLGCIVLILFQVILIALAFLGFYRYFGYETRLQMYIPYYFKSTRLLLVLSVLFLVGAILSLLVLCYRTLQSRQIAHIIAVLKIARICVMKNFYLPVFSLLLTALAYGIFRANMWCLNNLLGLVQLNPLQHGPYSQLKTTTLGLLLSFAWIVQFLWTHGLLISLSHWLFQIASTYWYYQPNNMCYGITSTFRLIFIHFGTITFGSYFPYYSQNLANLTNNIERDCNLTCYNCFCCCHNCCCRYLHIYSFILTGLKSLPFWNANIQFYHIRMRMRVNYPGLYMLGYLFNSTLKNLLISVSLIVMYVLLINADPETFMNLWYLIPPLVVGGLFIGQIVTFWVDLIGVVADTIVINYYMQRQFHLINGSPINASNCPVPVLEQLTKVDLIY